jgi:polyferredoxin
MNWFKPGWMVEAERLARFQAARAPFQKKLVLRRWAVIAAWVGIILIVGGALVAFLATPSRQVSQSLPSEYAWFGLLAVVLGFALVFAAKRFGVRSG